MNVGSLFSGIGGIDLGLERAGMRVVWQVECDPYARAVLRKHWPAAALYDDVRTVGAANLAPVDLVCGGFPCQDISNAGKRVGIEGERSGLWSEYARIVRELRPRYVLVENVAALLARGLERVVGDLAACGYDAEWDCFPAAAFGAPHRRDRLFIIAYATGERWREGRAEPERARAPGAGGNRVHVADAERVRQLQPQGGVSDERRRVGNGGSDVSDPERERREARRLLVGEEAPIAFAPERRNHVADSERERLQEPRVFRVSPGRRSADSITDGGWWVSEPDVGRVAHGVPSRVDRLRCLGNAVVPQVAEWIGRQILAHAEEAVIASRQLPLSVPGNGGEGA